MEMSGQLDAPAALLPRKKSPIAGLDAVAKRKISLLCQESNTNRQTHTLVTILTDQTHTLVTILTKLSRLLEESGNTIFLHFQLKVSQHV
jgi:hypothetical protein